MKQVFLLLLLILALKGLQSQDLSNLSEKKAVEFGGGINATTSFYDVRGMENRRQPFFWQINANVNVDLFGTSVPFSATFSNQQNDFSQPFNIVGVSPKYKWITAHLGYRSMNFSTYTLSGVRFFGAGVEADIPNMPIEVSAMHGRLNKGIDPMDIPVGVTAVDVSPASGPAYDRWGTGAKVKYNKSFGSFEFIAFRAEDRAGSIFVPDSLQDLRPAENMILGFNADINIDKKTRVHLELARSYYTQNTSLPEEAIEAFTFADNFGALFTANTSTQMNNAVVLGASRDFGKFELNAKYNRVDPGYQTMGSPFLNNDLQNITGGIGFGLLKNKINFTGDFGVQTDNIDGLKDDQMQRIILNANANIQASQKLNFSLTASNFTTNAYQTGIITNDTLQFFQITENYSLSAFYTLNADKVPQSIFLTVSQQMTEDAEDNNSQISNFNLGYTITLQSIGLTGNVSVNYFRNDINPILTNGVGPTVALSKQIFEGKGSINATYANAQTIINGDRNSNVHTGRVGFQISLFKNSTLGIDASIVDQNPYTEGAVGFTEYRGNVTYGYNF